MFGSSLPFLYLCSMKTVRLVLMLIFLGAVTLVSWAERDNAACPLVRIEAERLPNLHVARVGHTMCYVNGEPVVIGGHTSGFVPTATAEYFHDGEWHLMQTVYTHDHAPILPMKSGKIMIAGGHEQPLGIGQTFTLELYDPATHTFEGYGCMDKKRCFAQALEMDSGHVVISGNWYNTDGIELFDGSRQCLFVKDVTQQRSLPYMLRISRDNAIIFSCCDIKGKPHDTIIVDRLHGNAFTVPLFNEWKPVYKQIGHVNSADFIGNFGTGDYAYLLLAINRQGLLGFIKTKGEAFSLLPTACPIPMRGPWGRIGYNPNVVADRRAGRAYITGCGEADDHRLYVLSIDYTKTPATLTLYHTDQQDTARRYDAPILTADGNLLMAGGSNIPTNNFKPHAAAILLHIGHAGKGASTQPASYWLWAMVALIAAAALAVALFIRKRRQPATAAAEATATAAERADDEQLMQRICQLMDEERLYLNKDLKVSDVALRLGTNTTYISNCINSLKGCTFNQFVNTYRIAYAKQLSQQQPDMKLSSISLASGFSSEQSFFRNFKAITGMTPNEWRQKNS